MQDYVSLIMTDKGFPLQIIPKPNKWKLAYSAPQAGSGNGENSESEKEEYEYIFHVRYCLSKSYPDIINGAHYIKIYNSSVENQNAESKEYQFRESDYDNPYKISLGKVKESDTGIYSELLDYLKETYTEDIYSYKAISLEIGANIFEYICSLYTGTTMDRSFRAFPSKRLIVNYTIPTNVLPKLTKYITGNLPFTNYRLRYAAYVF